MGRIDDKRCDYEAAMAAKQNKAIGGAANPFETFALAAFVAEMGVLDKVLPAWNAKACQLSTGPAALSGGLYVLYATTGRIKAVVHPEKFESKYEDCGDSINFWDFHIRNGLHAAHDYDVPFVIIAEFADGIRYLRLSDSGPYSEPLETCGVGSRLGRPSAEYGDLVNVVQYVKTAAFGGIIRSAENRT